MAGGNPNNHESDRTALSGVQRIKVEAKLEQQAADRQAKEARITARRWRRKCFWTRPFGHVWKCIEPGYGYERQQCNACGSGRTKWFD